MEVEETRMFSRHVEIVICLQPRAKHKRQPDTVGGPDLDSDATGERVFAELKGLGFPKCFLIILS